MVNATPFAVNDDHIDIICHLDEYGLLCGGGGRGGLNCCLLSITALNLPDPES